MAKQLDLLVLGTGSAASTVANRCRSRGWEVAVVDSRPYGGTCALRGCDPKKVLVGAAEVVDWARRMGGKGVHAGGIRIDWPELVRFKRTFTEPYPDHKEKAFEKRGIRKLHGRARFRGPRRVEVNGEEIEAKRVVVATGMKPAKLPFDGAEHAITSDEFLELEALPERIVFVGGGYVSCEFAEVAALAGARVTILQRGDRILPRFDAELVEALVPKLRSLGVELRTSAEACGIRKTGGALRVCARNGSEESFFDADLVVHGAGRVPEIDDLDLETAGVERTQRGIKVNDRLQSVSNEAVWAAGDAADTDGPPLTPVAGYEGQIVAANLLGGDARAPNYAGIPTVVFTIPPLARVGLDEAQAQEAGKRFEVKRGNAASWYSSRRIGEEQAAYKVLIEEQSGRLLGVHLLGHAAEELINVFALAIRSGLSLDDVRNQIYAYPTHSSNLPYLI